MSIMTLAGIGYVCMGVALALFPNGSNLRGRLLVVAIWPWVLAVDGSPRIRWFTHFSGIEVVIEQTTALDGSIVQTVRQHTGHEYIRIAQP